MSMVTKDLLRQVIYEQRELNESLGVKRNIVRKQIMAPEVLVISGVRRCGKSVLLQQIRAEQTEQDYYLCFDDDRLLNFEVSDFQLMCDVFAEDFGAQSTFYLDEVQLIDGWERFVDRLYSHHNKVFITGSNAHLLSKELGTLLTGRHLTQELWPMSFVEYMELRNEKWQKSDLYTTAGKAKRMNLQNAYLHEGGFPQYLQTKNPRYLKELYNDIIYRDIVVRHKLPSDRQIREMTYFLASNFTHRFTYLSVAKAIGIKSSETVQDYIRHLEEAYLVGVLTKYDYKVGEQLKSPKKIYFVDNGLVAQIGFSFSGNMGPRLENAVYVELRRRDREVFYFQDKWECDFVVRENARITEAIQVTISMADTSTRQRELNGLVAAMDAFGLKEGIVVTMDESEELSLADGRLVRVIPYYRWIYEEITM